MRSPFNEAKYNVLLNGLEISEMRVSELRARPEELFRLDSEFYRQTVLKTWNKINEGKNSKLKNISNWITQGPNPIFSESGYPCLTGRNIATGFVKLANSDFINAAEFKALSRFKVLKGDILITLKGLGSTGKVGFIHKDLDAVFSRNIGVIRANSCDIAPEFLMVFLMSKYGQRVIDRGVTGGTGQRTLPTTYLKGLKIPRYQKLEIRVANMLKQALDADKHSVDLVKDSKRTLLDSLNYLHPPTAKNVTSKSFSSSFAISGRLDAEFYQPKYDELFTRIHANAEYVKTVGEMETFNARGLQPIYAEEGTLDVINSRHILEDGLDYDNLEKTQSTYWKKQKRARVQRNDILVYTTGANIGRSQPYLSDEQALASNHVNIIRIQFEDPVYVAFVMNSVIGRMQTERLSAGTAQAELYPKDISQFIIPFVAKEKQDEIVGSILLSREQKTESRNLLEKAKQAVEIAIEQGEEAAVAYLEGRKYVEQTISNDLASQAPYFSIDAARKWLTEQKMSYKPETVNTYLSRQMRAGKIFDAGRGWYSSIEEPYQLDTASVQKLVNDLTREFPLLDFACWSTAQLNEMLRHQLARHVQLVYVERDAIQSVARWLQKNGFHIFANPGKQEIAKSFSVEENTVIVLPLTTESPCKDGFAFIEKILVDVLADLSSFDVTNITEFIEGARNLIKSYRVDISVLNRYATRRKTEVGPIIKG